MTTVTFAIVTAVNICIVRNMMSGITGQPFSPLVPRFAARISRVFEDLEAPGGKTGNV